MTQIVVRDADGAVLAWGTSLAAGSGASVLDLDSAGLGAFLAAQAAPNAGIVRAADGTYSALPPAPPDPLDAKRATLATAAPGDDSADLDALRTYYGLATPTAAQTTAAFRVLLRVLAHRVL